MAIHLYQSKKVQRYIGQRVYDDLPWAEELKKQCPEVTEEPKMDKRAAFGWCVDGLSVGLCQVVQPAGSRPAVPDPGEPRPSRRPGWCGADAPLSGSHLGRRARTTGRPGWWGRPPVSGSDPDE